jgi:hypothetical protein
MEESQPFETKSSHPNTSSNLTPNQQEGNRKQKLKKDTVEKETKARQLSFSHRHPAVNPSEE